MILSLPCGPSMMDCPETSGNRQRRFPDFSINKFFFEKKNTLIKNSGTCRKPAGNLRGRFPEVSGQSIIDGPHGIPE